MDNRQQAAAISDLQATLLSQRAKLVRLCMDWTGDADAAEDLAQEALLQAWQRAHQLRDPNAYEAWLKRIVRNICLRWN